MGRLGWTPLALAVASRRGRPQHSVGESAGSVRRVSEWYAASGWKVDRCVLRALDEVDRQADCLRVCHVDSDLSAVARPRGESASGCGRSGGQLGPTYVQAAPTPKAGEVVVLIDGLRLDVAHVLGERLEGAGALFRWPWGWRRCRRLPRQPSGVVVPIDQAYPRSG